MWNRGSGHATAVHFGNTFEASRHSSENVAKVVRKREDRNQKWNGIALAGCPLWWPAVSGHVSWFSTPPQKPKDIRKQCEWNWYMQFSIFGVPCKLAGVKMFDNLITGRPPSEQQSCGILLPATPPHRSPPLHLATNHSSQVKESRAWHKCLTTKLQFNCPAKAEQKQCLFFLHCSWLVEMTSDAGGRRIAKIKCDPNNLADRLVKRAVPTKRQKISWKIKTKGFSVVEKTEHWKDEYNNAKTNYEVNKARYMSPYKAPRYSVPRQTGN